MKVQIFVMPARMTGIHQLRNDAPETSMSAWVPAFHVGTTQSMVVLELTGAFSRMLEGGAGAHEDNSFSR